MTHHFCKQLLSEKNKINRISSFFIEPHRYIVYIDLCKSTEVMVNPNYVQELLISSKVFFGFNKLVSDYFYVSKKRNQMQYWSALEFNFLLQIPSGSLDQTKRNSAVALYVCTSYVG